MTTPMTAVLTAPKRRSWLENPVLAVILLILFQQFFPDLVWSPVSDSARRAQAKADVALLCAALKQYFVEYGAMPAGNQAQIMTTLQGANPLKIVLFQDHARRFNAAGEYLDPWGTPFRIDASNPTFPWAYSFGKDTKDDGGVPGSDDVTNWH